MTHTSLLIPAALLLSLPILATHPMMQQAAPAPAPATASKISPEATAKTKRLYAMECAMCHNDNGDGKSDLARDMKMTVPDMTAYGALNAMSDQEIFDLIRKGKDKMPAETPDRAKDEEIRNLVIYIRTFSASAEAPAPTAAPASAASVAPSIHPAGN